MQNVMNTDNLLILNGCEKPCAYLICKEYPDGRIQYVNKTLAKRYGNMRKDSESATLKEFGFAKIGDKFILTNPSIAKYEDGKIRKWQSRITEFTYQEIVNMKGFD
jgi:hypothetical protein